MKVVNREEVYALLSMQDCIDAMRETFMKLHKGSCIQFLRKRVHLPGGTISWGNIMSMMPAYYDEEYCGAKVFTVFPDNTRTSLPTHQGLVLLFSSQNGELLAAIDAHAVTEIRTAAVTALATDILANPGAKTAAFIGAGTQARSHLESILAVRPLASVTVFDPDEARANAFVRFARELHGVDAHTAKSAHEAAAQADIVTTATTSRTPVIALADVKKGALVNAVGACAPEFRELSTDLVAAARYFGDSRESVMNEAGDFLLPLSEKAIGEAHFLAELSQVVSGEVPGRVCEEDIVIFKSLGLAVEDISAAKYIYEKLK